MNVDKVYLKKVVFSHFFDYLALELNFDNDYKFSDYYKLLETINKDKNIKIFKNFNNNYDLLDLVNDCYNNFAIINLCYNSQELFIGVNNGKLYYNIYINIKHKLFKDYKNMQHFINELEDYIDFTFFNNN